MIEKYLNDIIHKLNSVIRRENIKSSLKGFSLILIGFGLTYLGFALLEMFFNFSGGARTGIFYSVVIIFLLLTIYYVVFPLIKRTPLTLKPDYPETAKRVGEYFPEIKDDLSNALQLLNSKGIGFSQELVEAAFEKVYNKAKDLEFENAVEFSSLKKYWQTAGGLMAAIILLFIFSPGLQSAAHRLTNYDKEFIVPAKFVLSVDPGDAEIAKGENLKVSVNVTGDKPESIYLAVKSSEDAEYEEKKVNPDSTGKFNYEFLGVRNSFDYYAHAEGITSGNYKVNVIDRPIVNNFELIITPPAYTGLPREVQKENGNITAITGSNVKFKLTSTKFLKEAKLVFGKDSEIKLNVTNQSASNNFRISSDGEYFISITDTMDHTNSNPIKYSVKTIADEYPVIEIVSPGEKVKLAGDNNLAITSKISDDFGFTKLILNYKLAESKYSQPDKEYKQLTIPIRKSRKEDEIYYGWNLSPMFLAEGDVVDYYLEIFDNDAVNGPKSTKSSKHSVFVPSLNELFAEADDTQNKAHDELNKTLEEAKNLNDELQKISDELKQDNKEISYEERTKIEKSLQKFDDLTKKVDEVKKNLSKMQNDLMQNELLSKETLDKYLELQDLLDQIGSEEMKEALQKLQEMLKSMQRDNVQNSFENMKLNEELFKKSLERTVNLLKRIQVEQKVDEIVKRMEDLNKKIEETKKNTEQSDLKNSQEKNELGKRQDEISKNLEDLQKEMDKLGDKMKDVNDMPSEKMKQASEEFKKQGNKELSENAEKNIQSSQKSQALENQNQLSKNMQSAMSKMQAMQKEIQQKQQMQVFKDMVKVLDNIISVSKEQEKLLGGMESTFGPSKELIEKAKKENDIKDNLLRIMKQMNELSQKTFAVNPAMGKAMGQALAEMNQSINMMQNGNGISAKSNQTNAMSHLNEAANLIQNSMNNMMNGGGGGGMMSLMQQLQQMSQQQMNLNQLTQQLNQQGRLSQQQMAQLQRLSQQQEAIRKSLAELNREAEESGKSKSLAANLEKILKDMQEVVTNMQTEKVDDDLVQKQERILSKLLDAQRSINERDYEKERESKSGKLFTRKSPGELLTGEERQNQLRDELIKAVREGYSKDYEELIRKYFEALQKEGN